jgi:hypothetical protein
MTAEQAWQAALVDMLRSMDGLNGVYEGPPVKASEPWAELGELLSFDWSTKDMAGRELRSTVFVRDRAEGPARLHTLAAAVDAAAQAVPRDLEGWRIASLTLIRNRIMRDRPGGWTAMVEHRVRLLAG